MARDVFAKRLKELRQDQGLTQAELAAALDCSTSTIKRWEGGQDTVPFYRFFDLAHVLGVPVTFLVGLLARHDRERHQKWERLEKRFRDWLTDEGNGGERAFRVVGN